MGFKLFSLFSAADFQWPEPANLICRVPVLADMQSLTTQMFFLQAISAIPQVLLSGYPWCSGLLVEVLVAVCGRLHVHCLAWLPGAPNVQLFTDPAAPEENHWQAIAFIDSVIMQFVTEHAPHALCLLHPAH